MQANDVSAATTLAPLRRHHAEPQPQQLEAFLDCALCLKALFQPVTTTCGHSYCRNCLASALEYKKLCPLCRAPCFLAPDHPTNVTLQRIVESFYPDVCKQRISELRQDCKDKKMRIPLFVEEMVQFPFALLSLHLYESRYKLLAQRCNEGGSRVFGVVYLPKTGSVQSVVGSAGCLVEITLAHETPDGRWYIHAKGVKRFRIESVCEEPGTDGLVYATVRDIDAEADIERMVSGSSSASLANASSTGSTAVDGGTFAVAAAPGTPALGQERAPRNAGVSAVAEATLMNVDPRAHPDAEAEMLCLRLRVLLEDYFNSTFWSRLNLFSALIGPSRRIKSLPESPLKFSYWAAGFLPVSLQQKQKLLDAPTVNERLRLEVEMLREIVHRESRQSNGFLWLLLAIVVVFVSLYFMRIAASAAALGH
ncbi:hypothetical protein CAOG_05330 [Capsaspora owczarzaki ATCC 30864]|uniref:RING-type domain-containing protein n=1 Tax=Capsaspora owczarzaki (strain ATCC 30864) TaxID=595528 RepID=A0A0D2WT41_CAPO3|nr:hypothetical protein CAOG_05330 [Capsaspora owczarzaki ATCC 30864]KJE94738.1 hypothetical protein CAOG_005330 [Capsaspora owczarzaki ATCC 30864]|eukprot:XP_004347015.1 hypothetical protein CAOG_05330 [Capsaspora owczarzaki ATCC 30864]